MWQISLTLMWHVFTSFSAEVIFDVSINIHEFVTMGAFLAHFSDSSLISVSGTVD
jgi:hypothetical protein